ncbi:unnamed protein product [Microthlaspi erraticum]|uniref:Uncharacterized protein n=1 Tax=Microthlaspi erraticum TaxID=1685480 RepID=A0A6D2L2M7_9BRAS|nr:unnamed protein product [Microthlaspi erraticum]
MVYNTRSVTKKKNSTEAETNNQTWSNLPSDLTSLINQNLSLKDNIRASAVCKTWHQDPTPWVMFIPIYKDECNLYDPSLAKTHIVKCPALRDSHVLYSKDGWLLMQDRKLSKPFFFNPFTQVRIEVDWRDLWLSDAIAFSCAPTSSSCVIFAVDDIGATHFFIRIHRHTINKRNASFTRHR